MIAHLIDPCVCLARQRELYHKCHRCIYRGKAADWVVALAAAGPAVAAMGERMSPDVPWRTAVHAQRPAAAAAAAATVAGTATIGEM